MCREPILIVDFPKEFDLIDHNILLKEPSSFIDPVLVNWIKAFLSDRRQAVRIGNFLSDWKFLKGGRYTQGLLTIDFKYFWSINFKFHTLCHFKP